MTEQSKQENKEDAGKTAEKVPGKPFQKGHDPRRNLNGRPKGVKNFKTIFEEAVKKIAKEKEIDPESIEVDLVIKAIAEARRGDYKYYKDIFDRIYGQPKQTIGLDDEDFITKITLEIKDGKDTTDNISDEEELEGVSEQEE